MIQPKLTATQKIVQVLVQVLFSLYCSALHARTVAARRVADKRHASVRRAQVAVLHAVDARARAYVEADLAEKYLEEVCYAQEGVRL